MATDDREAGRHFGFFERGVTPIPISVFTIKDTVSIKAWEPTNVWPKLKKGLEQGIGGAKEAIQEAYAVVTSPIGEDFGPEHIFGLHHEVTDEGDVVLNKFALAKAAADLSANTSLTDDQKAAARAHLRRHYQELEEEPPASLVEGEMSIPRCCPRWNEAGRHSSGPRG